MSSLNGDCAGELLGSARSVILHSGNIASWNKLRRKGVLTSTDELVSIIDASFTSWLGRQREEEEDGVISVRNAGLCQRVEPDEVSNHIFSLKIFLNQWNPQLLRDAVQRTLGELGLSSVHTIAVAFPFQADIDEFKLDQATPIWKEAELLLNEGVAKEMGVADLNKERLEALYNATTVKPMINQINMAHCCVIPEDLLEFSKSHSIKLNTHNDDRDILPLTQLHSSLSSTLEGRGIDHTPWTPCWVARYSSVIKLRGIIGHKGYVLKMETNNQPS